MKRALVVLVLSFLGVLVATCGTDGTGVSLVTGCSQACDGNPECMQRCASTSR